MSLAENLTPTQRRLADERRARLQRMNAAAIGLVAKKVAPKPISTGPKPLQVMDIKRAVSRKYRLTLEQLDGEQRTNNIVIPRHIAVYLCTRLTKLSLPAIGRKFGGRDHTTVMNSRDRIEEMRMASPSLDRDLTELEVGLTGREAEEFPSPGRDLRERAMTALRTGWPTVMDLARITGWSWPAVYAFLEPLRGRGLETSGSRHYTEYHYEYDGSA